MVSVNISNIAIITVKSVLEDRGYLLFQFLISFFLLFLFSLYKRVDSKDIYRYLNINIGKVMKNPEMLKFAPDHLKTKQMCNYAVNELRFVIIYLPDQYKNKKICNRANLENGGTPESVPNQYKTQKMCNKA